MSKGVNMPTVEQILLARGSDVPTISPDATVYQALSVMAEKDYGALPVVDREGHICGMVSERDYSRKVILHGLASKNTPVSQIMSSDVFVATPELTLHQCMSLMTERGVRHLPVVRQEKLIGMISILQVVRAIIEDQRSEIERLEEHLYGGTRD